MKTQIAAQQKRALLKQTATSYNGKVKYFPRFLLHNLKSSFLLRQNKDLISLALAIVVGVVVVVVVVVEQQQQNSFEKYKAGVRRDQMT